MLSKKIILKNKLGLHARAAAKFVELTNHFAAETTVTCNDKKANGKNIMELMLLSANKGLEIELIVNGKDEALALTALEKLIDEKFGEAE